MRAWMVIVLVLAPAVASAKVKHPVYDVVEKLGAPDSDAHLKETALMVLPNGELRREVRTLKTTDLGYPTGTTLRITKLQTGQFARTELEWIVADIDAKAAGKTIGKLRLVAIGTAFIPDEVAYPILVAHWIKPIADKDARKRAVTVPDYKDEKVPAPKDIGDEQARIDYDNLLDETYDGGDAVNDMLADDVTRGIVIGSGPGELWKGKSGQRAIKAWKTKLEKRGGTFRIGVGRAHVLVARYDGAVPYVGMIAYGDEMTGGGSMVTGFGFASFAVPQ